MPTKQPTQKTTTRTDLPIESHPFERILPPHAKALMMGTMPPTSDKWCMPFHYPNFYNDMWRIFGLVFFDNADHFRIGEEKRFDHHKIKAFLLEKGIGECPTVVKVIREKGNASDEHLTVVETVKLDDVLPLVPDVKWLFTTGGKATEVLIDIFNEEIAKENPTAKSLKLPKTNEFIEINYQGRRLNLYRLPSTSRAYPMSLDNKAKSYKAFFEKAGLL